MHYFSTGVVILSTASVFPFDFHISSDTVVFLHISEFLFCHVHFSRPGGRCTCTFNCFIIFGQRPLLFFFVIMATARPFDLVTSENVVPGPISI